MFRLHRRYFCISANVKLAANQNRPEILDHMIEQCQLGFPNLQIPLNMFDQMMSLFHRPRIFYFNQLFSAMVRLKHLQPYSTVISLSKQLELSDIRFDSRSIGILVNCYCHLARVDFAFSLCAKSLKLGYPIESDIGLFAMLINGLVDNDQLPQAVKLLDVAVVKLGIRPDVITYGVVVKGLCRVGDTDCALHLLHRLNSHPMYCKPDLVIYNTLIGHLCKDKLYTEALKVSSVMKTEGIKPNVVTYSSLIQGLSYLGRKGEAKEMLVEMMDNNISPNVCTYAILVNMYCKDGMIDEAHSIIGMMVKRGLNLDVLAYGTLIDAYVKLNHIDKAFDILQEMLKHGIAPNDWVYTTLIDRLCKSGKLQMARQLFKDMQIRGIKPSIGTYGALLDGLCKGEHVNEAIVLLAEMESNGVAPNLFIYNILIHNLCQAGQVLDAENFVSELLSRGLVPNHVTFTIMIRGFRNKGLTSTAIKFLDKMKQIGCCPDHQTLVKKAISSFSSRGVQGRDCPSNPSGLARKRSGLGHNIIQRTSRQPVLNPLTRLSGSQIISLGPDRVQAKPIYDDLYFQLDQLIQEQPSKCNQVESIFKEFAGEK